MQTKIWIYGEIQNSEIHPVVFEILGKASELSVCFDEKASVEVIVIGHVEKVLLDDLEINGADIIRIVDDVSLKQYSPISNISILTNLAEKYKPDIFLFGSTGVGKSLGPSVAARLKTGMAAHCIDLRINNNKQLVSDVPAFGGNVIGEILCPNTTPQMASIKPGVFEKKQVASNKATILKEELVNLLDTLDLSGIEHVREVKTLPSGVLLSKANIVVCGGFGVANSEGWSLINNIANKLGGAVACTRPLVDAGFASEDQMVGTSGCNVKPEVYLGFGISGAAHHLCGMSSSKHVININKDKKASVFSYSDICIVEDAIAILQELDNIIK